MDGSLHEKRSVQIRNLFFLLVFFGIQCVLNVAVVIGMIPTTGLPLPFFSSGGTSIAIILGVVGVLLSVSAYGRQPA